MWILDIFVLYQWKWSTKVTFQKNYFENLKNLQSFVNIFAFFIKISCQSIEFPLSKQSTTLSLTPLCLEKKDHFHPFGQVRESQAPLYKGGGGGGGVELWHFLKFFEVSRVSKFLKAVRAHKKINFNNQGNPKLLLNIPIISFFNKIQLLQKQRFINYFVKNLRKTTEFDFLYFTFSLKKHGEYALLSSQLNGSYFHVLMINQIISNETKFTKNYLQNYSSFMISKTLRDNTYELTRLIITLV